MSQPAFSSNITSLINPHSQKLAQIRQDILTLFMENEETIKILPTSQTTSLIARRLNFDYKVCYELFN